MLIQILHHGPHETALIGCGTAFPDAVLLLWRLPHLEPLPLPVATSVATDTDRSRRRRRRRWQQAPAVCGLLLLQQLVKGRQRPPRAAVVLGELPQQVVLPLRLVLLLVECIALCRHAAKE